MHEIILSIAADEAKTLLRVKKFHDARRTTTSRSIGRNFLCHDSELLTIKYFDKHNELVFTYDVIWTPSPVRWASRWDNYLKMSEGQIHWFSIINSLMIVLFLSGMVAMILLRTLHRDISKYNELASAEDAAEEKKDAAETKAKVEGAVLHAVAKAEEEAAQKANVEKAAKAAQEAAEDREEDAAAEEVEKAGAEVQESTGFQSRYGLRWG